MTEITCVSPVDGSVYATRPAEAGRQRRGASSRARAQRRRPGRARPLDERIALVEEGVARLDRVNADLVTELAWQMGRPVRYGGEMGGVRERTAYMAGIAARGAGAGGGRGQRHVPPVSWRASRSGSSSSSRPGTTRS